MMVQRYTVNSEFVFEDCLVALSVHDAIILEVWQVFHLILLMLHVFAQQNKASTIAGIVIFEIVTR